MCPDGCTLVNNTECVFTGVCSPGKYYDFYCGMCQLNGMLPGGMC